MSRRLSQDDRPGEAMSRGLTDNLRKRESRMSIHFMFVIVLRQWQGNHRNR